MLTRYMEEAESGASTELALKSTMRQSGHVVMISASVLIICYVGVLFYPSGGIATIGLGASLTVFLCALSNLTLTPALTTALPSLFGADAGIENLRLRASRRSQSSCGRRCNCRGSGKCWPRVAKVVTKQPGVFANTLTFPGKSDTSLAYHQLISEFPAGKLSPQYVIIPASGNETVRSDEYFNFSCHIANSLLQELSGDPFYLTHGRKEMSFVDARVP
eukprot:g15190.t1